MLGHQDVEVGGGRSEWVIIYGLFKNSRTAPKNFITLNSKKKSQKHACSSTIPLILNNPP